MKYSVILFLLFPSSLFAQDKTLATDKGLEVITWNLEWFGNKGKGPSNEEEQMQMAYSVLQGFGEVDVIVFEEICDSKLFKRLADTSGYDYYLSPGSDNSQKLGFFYSSDLEIIDSAETILEEHKFTFARRLPVQISLKHPTLGQFTVIGLHLKANIPRDTYDKREDSYQRRKKAAELLQEYVSSYLSAEKVIILGDWNDDVDVSNHDNKETPFSSLIESEDFRFVTYYLSFAFVESSKYGSVIDHICITDELFSNFRSSAVVDVNDNFKGYLEDCSDHYPVYVVFE